MQVGILDRKSERKLSFLCIMTDAEMRNKGRKKYKMALSKRKNESSQS